MRAVHGSFQYFCSHVLLIINFANFASRRDAQLPVVTQELADTWIWGTGSDPVKVAKMRALHDGARLASADLGLVDPNARI